MDDSNPADGNRARRFGGALEPVIGQVYFARESHEAYTELGFSPSPGDMKGVHLPDGVAYFTSRGSLLGQVPGQVVAAAFGVFDPAIVVPAVTRGWELTDAATIADARDRGAISHLERHLGPDPEGLDLVERGLRRAADALSTEGRPLAAGALAREAPDHRLGRVFRCGDGLREHRGDSHTAAWISEGLTAIDIGLLTELFWGLPLRSYSRTRGWSDAQYDVAEERLTARGLIRDGDFTDEGRALREHIESTTDRQMAHPLDAIGDDLEAVITTLDRWGRTIREGRGYPDSGPHELAEAASSR